MSFRNYLARKGLSEGTIDKYHRISLNIDQNQPVIWFEEQLAQRQPISTLLTKRAACSHLMNYLNIDGDLPATRGTRSKMRSGLSPIQCEEFLRRLESIPEPSRSILKICFATGMRISEVCQLKYSNIEFAEDDIFFVFSGKGSKQRIVPVPRSVRSLVENESDSESWIFVGRNGHFRPQSVRHWCQRISDKRLRVSPHILRHTFATQAIRKGIDLKTLQVLLGHSQINTTSRYLHPSKEDLRAAMSRLDI